MLSNHLLAALDKHSNINFDQSVFEWKRLALAGDCIINMFAQIVQDRTLKENHTLNGLWDLQSTPAQKKKFNNLFSFRYHDGFDRQGCDQHLIKSATLCEAYIYLEYNENGWYCIKTKLLDWFKTKCSSSNKNVFRLGITVVRFNLVTRLLQNPNISAHLIEQYCKKYQNHDSHKYEQIGQQFLQTENWIIDPKQFTK
jgi:hypothetical protein